SVASTTADPLSAMVPVSEWSTPTLMGSPTGTGTAPALSPRPATRPSYPLNAHRAKNADANASTQATAIAAFRIALFGTSRDVEPVAPRRDGTTALRGPDSLGSSIDTSPDNVAITACKSANISRADW